MRWLINLMITSMIFFPEKTFYERPEDYGFAYEDVFLTTADGVKIHGWYLNVGARSPRPGQGGVTPPLRIILFFHGNAGNISGRLFKVKGWVDLGFSVLLIDYRSYGKSEGEIRNEKDILTDAQAAFDWLSHSKKIPTEKIILYGESLGTWPAIQLGASQKVGAVILEAPFTSFLDLGRKHYSAVPGLNFLMKDFHFQNQDAITSLKAPLFILHGTQDEICPYEMSQELFERAPGPKSFFTIENGHHNDLPMAAGEGYWQKPFEFVSSYL